MILEKSRGKVRIMYKAHFGHLVKISEFEMNLFNSFRTCADMDNFLEILEESMTKLTKLVIQVRPGGTFSQPIVKKIFDSSGQSLA